MNYTAQRGDTLGTIAQKFLGSSTRWREVWAANPGITDPNKISVGQIIKVPGQSQAQTALVPVQTPVVSAIPMRDVTNSIPPSMIQRLMQDKKMLMLLGIGIAAAIYLTMKKTKGQAA